MKKQCLCGDSHEVDMTNGIPYMVCPLAPASSIFLFNTDNIERGTRTMPIDQDELDRRFDHHPPTDEDTIHRHEEIRRHGKMFAYAVTQLVPEGREQSMALTDIEDAVMHANAGIARNQQ